jgi:hypothetical protein
MSSEILMTKGEILLIYMTLGIFNMAISHFERMAFLIHVACRLRTHGQAGV